jgi:4-diphosphocytidyl-2-C-methyl-D-erythritol kinase
VLINPGVAVETKPVFQRLGLSPGERADGSAHPAVEPGMEREALWRALAKGRNDLEDAAAIEAPIIGDVLAVLAGARGFKLARMSGSGATCFGLFTTSRAAVKASRAIRAAHPGWWVKAAVLR